MPVTRSTRPLPEINLRRSSRRALPTLRPVENLRRSARLNKTPIRVDHRRPERKASSQEGKIPVSSDVSSYLPPPYLSPLASTPSQVIPQQTVDIDNSSSSLILSSNLQELLYPDDGFILPLQSPSPSGPVLHPHSSLGKDGYVPPPLDLTQLVVESIVAICDSMEGGQRPHLMTTKQMLDKVEEEQKRHALQYPGYHPRSRRSFGTQTN